MLAECDCVKYFCFCLKGIILTSRRSNQIAFAFKYKFSLFNTNRIIN